MNAQSTHQRSPDECVAERLRVVTVKSAADIFRIARNDASTGEAEESLEELAEHAHQLAPLKFIADHLQKLGCKTVLVQYPVVDKDYQAEFQAFYSTTFRNYSRYSTRLHFFTTPLQEKMTALQFIDHNHSHAENSSGYLQTDGYLGYVNIRPVISSPVGRTVLRAPADCKFLTVKDSFRSTLADKDFWVVGTPFMQQDSSVAACAQVAMWMALRVTKKRDGKEDKTVAEISAAATKELVFGRILPTAGLGLNNIQAALEKFGYHGHLLNFSSNKNKEEASFHTTDIGDKIKNDLYPYLESGIPVMAICDDANSEFKHVVVIVGHGWNPQGETHHHKPREIKLSNNEVVRVHLPTVWIDDLYVNNDNSGPYQKWGDSKANKHGAISEIKAAMPLLPKDVYLSAEQAQAAADRILRDAFDALISAGNLGKQIKLDDIDHKFVIRCYLTSRHEFRKWASMHQSKDMTNYYRQKHLPEKLWVFEINTIKTYFDIDAANSTPDARRLGELLIDPTGDPHDYPLLSLHLNLTAIADKAIGFLINVDMHPEPKIDLIYLNETVKNYPLQIPYKRL